MLTMAERRKKSASVKARHATVKTVPSRLTPDQVRGAYTPDDRASEDVTRRMSPGLVDSLLKGAAGGEPLEIFKLHNAMIRTWPRLAKNIGKLRRAAGAAPWTTMPWSDPKASAADTAAAEDRAETVRRIIKGMAPGKGALEVGWRGLVAGLAENVVRGTGVAQLLSHPHDDGRGLLNMVRAARITHPNYYAWPWSGSGFDETKSGDRLMFRPGGRTGGRTLTEWPENEFLVQLSPAWNEHPAMSGLLGTLGMVWILANYGPQLLFDYAQTFGIPLVWANYPQGDVKARDVVFGMLRNLTGKRYAAFPEGTLLHMAEAMKAAGDLPQKMLIDLADTICDILLCGQTLTTETKGVGSQALGNVHEGIELGVLMGMCQEVADTMTEQFVPAVLMWNYGDTKFAPTITHGLVVPEDELAKAERDEIIMRSAPVGRAWFYERHNIPVPADDEETLGGVTQPKDAGTPPKTGGDKKNTSGDRVEESNRLFGGDDDSDDDAAPGNVKASAADLLKGDTLQELTAVLDTVLQAAVKTGWEKAGAEMAGENIEHRTSNVQP